MPTKLRPHSVATEGTNSDARFQSAAPVETPGNNGADRCQSSKALAVNCGLAAIESFLASHQMSRETLAENLCGMSLGNFSKISNGVQGDFLDLMFNRVPADIREDFVERLAAMQRVDPFANAIKHLVLAAFSVIEHTRGSRLPSKADHMAHVEFTASRRESA